LLFQSGETAYGVPIADGQHPHEFFVEIAGRYDFSAGDRTRLFIYGGPRGEPAPGPASYPHRASASQNPVAVLGHHQQDSTHIANNVLTVGFVRGPLQVEASTFQGQEPDESRWNIGGGKPDSFSSRISWSAGDEVVAQISAGRIHNREAMEHGLDTFRTTASLHHSARFSSGHVSSSLIWGRNRDSHGCEARIFNAYTAESTVNFLTRNWLWTRIENVDRDQRLLTGEKPETADVEEAPIGRVQAYSFGYERDLPLRLPSMNVGLGIQLTAYSVPPPLKPVYGNHPAGFTFFLHLRPAGNTGHAPAMHQH
jgi:hypothetical protein